MRTDKTLDLDFKFNKIAGEVIREKRIKANMSLNDVASRTRTTRQNIHKYEISESRLKVDMFISICYAIHCNPQDVFDEINERVKNTKI